MRDFGLRIGGAVGAVGLIVLLVFMGDSFNIGFLQPQGGILVSVVIVGEVLFFAVLLFAVLYGDF